MCVCVCVYVCVCVCVFRVPVNEYNASYVCCDPPPPPPQLVHCCILCTNYLQLSHFHVPNVLNLSNVMHKHALISSTTPPSIYTTFTERNLPNFYPVHSAFFHTFGKIKNVQCWKDHADGLCTTRIFSNFSLYHKYKTSSCINDELATPYHHGPLICRLISRWTRPHNPPT